MSTPSMITAKLRDKRGNRRGLVAACKQADGSVRIGYSLHNPKDKFKSTRGLEIAVARANSGRKRKLPVCEDTQELLCAGVMNITHRAARYFKECTDIEHCLDVELKKVDDVHFDIKFNYDPLAEERRVLDKK